MESRPIFLDVAEVARILTKSESWVRQAAADEILPAYKIGGEWKFDIAELDAYIRAQHN